MSDPAFSTTFHWRDLEFDPQSRSVTVDGRTTVLDPRSTRVFAALAGNFQQGVSKDELLRAGWPGQLVHENSLAKAVSKLRQAIGGSGLEIVVAYGFGYTLREIVKSAASAGTREEAEAIALVEQPQSRHGSRALVGLLVVALVTLGALAWVGPESGVSIREDPPVTNDPPDAVATILWVDDHPVNNEREVEEFRRKRIAVHLAKSTDDAMKLLAMNRYELVVSDLGRGEDRLAGIKMADLLRDQGSSVPIIIYTIRPADRAGQIAQRRLVQSAGVNDLAVTPQEVRQKVLNRVNAS